MRRVAWLGLVVVACAQPKPEKLEEPRSIPVEHAEQARAPVVELTPRPQLDLSQYLPEFHDELRWPLTPLNHPVLEPQFPIAEAFAEPGVGWVELCGRGVQNRYGGDKELLSYLRGWCNAINRDADGACSNLVPLLGSTVPQLDAAVRKDLANILADSGHADSAEHLINVHHIRDIRILDLLAANYVEVGTGADALAINHAAIDSDAGASAAVKCTRWTRSIVLAGATQSELLQEIENLATKPKVPDATCVRLHHKLQCWAGHNCSELVSDLGGDPRMNPLVTAYLAWDGAVSAKDWLAIFEWASLAIPLPGAGSLAIASLENAVHVGRRCTPAVRKWIDYRSQSLRLGLDDAQSARLDVLIERCAAAGP